MTDVLSRRLADLDDAAREFVNPLDSDAGLWTAARKGRWTGGQHAEHVAICLERLLASFEEALPKLRSGSLGPVPRRGPIQSLFLAIVVDGGRMPRGAPTKPFAFPGSTPDRDAVLARIRRAPADHRHFAESLSDDELRRLWIVNPFAPLRWHYLLHEEVRIHAVHLRHHGRQVVELRS